MDTDEVHAFSQKKDGWCGPAALSYIFNHFGMDVPQEEIAKELEVGKEGVNPEDLVEFALSSGLDVKVLKNQNAETTLKIVTERCRKNQLALLDYTAGPDVSSDGHYIVCHRVSDKLQIFNPSSGGKLDALDTEWFKEHWKDIDEDGKEFHNYAAIFTKA